MPQQRDYIGKALGDALSQIGATFGTAMQERARLEAVKALQGKIASQTDFTVSPAQPSPDGYPTIPQVAQTPRHPLDMRNAPDLTRLGELSPNALQTILATFGASQPTLMEVDAGGTVMNRNRMTGQTTYETVPGTASPFGSRAMTPFGAFISGDPSLQKKAIEWEGLNDRPPTPFIIQTPGGYVQVDKTTGVGKPITDQTGAQIQQPPTTDTRNRIASIARAKPILNAISELSEKINTGNGVLAKIKGGVERAKAEANLNDDLAEYNALISGFTPMVARSLGHSGVLTEQDVQSVKDMFPKAGDSKSLRDRKIQRILNLLGEIEDIGKPDRSDVAPGTPSVGGVPTDEEINKMTPEQLKQFLKGK